MAVQEQFLPGEHVFAFLDDVFALPERTSAIYTVLEETLPQQASGHTGRPEHGTEQVRSSWATKCGTPQGIKILGTPVGSEESTLLARERGWPKRLWCKISNVLGSSWCSVRVHGRKVMTGGCRRLWPQQSGKPVGDIAHANGSGEDCPCSMLGIMGDALHMTPDRPLFHSSGGEWTADVVWANCKTFDDHRGLSRGQGLVHLLMERAGEWQHGWQYYASSSLEYHSGDRSACPVCANGVLHRARRDKETKYA